MELSEILKEKIKKEGPVSFRDFMDSALYYPSVGYYNSATNKIGRNGDFYTSPVLSSLFGEMIGKQIEEMWLLLDKKPFTIVEYGAGTGALCFDILNYLKNNGAFFQELNYCIIEKSESMKVMQKKLLSEKVKWCDSIHEIGAINGCVFSNEVLDNFPVHRVVMKEELMEIFIDYENNFIEVINPANEEIKKYLDEQNIHLPKDYCTEINLQALDWIKEIADNLNRGYVITIDYGFTANEFYNEKRNSGSLICYKGQQINSSFYSDIGKQDITAHVNFTALNIWGEKAGLQCLGFTSQANFLRSLGLINFLRKLETENKDENMSDILFQINQLLMSMGNKFKVLIQQKGVKSRMLSGLQFANPCP